MDELATRGATEYLDLLVQAVRKSPKYRNVCLEVVRNVGARELAARRNSRHSAESAERSPAKNTGCSSDSRERGTPFAPGGGDPTGEYQWKDAVKATKNKLHQVGGAYFDTGIPYAQGAWLRQMRSAVGAGNQDELRRICAEVMEHHSSTRERLAILGQFYTQTLAGLPPPQVVLDLACGFNPLAIPWMPFDRDVQYYAYDMYTDLASFLNEFMGIVGVRGQAEACDVIQSPPTRRADLALILKTVPCAEQQDKLAGARLLEAIRADHLLVSFPVRSLGGRDKGMLDNYEAHFQELVLGKPWSVQRFEFSTELAFLIHK